MRGGARIALRHATDCAQNPHVRAATAEVRRHVAANLGVARRGIRVEQRLRAHDHAGDAIAALRRLLVEERALQRIRIVHAAQRLDRANRAPAEHRDRRDAREHSLAVDDDRARAALTEAAAELRAVQLQMVPQHVKKRRIGIGVDRVPLIVDDKVDHGDVSCVTPRTVLSTSLHGVRSLKRARTYSTTAMSYASVNASRKPGMITPDSPGSGCRPLATIRTTSRGVVALTLVASASGTGFCAGSALPA